MNLIFEYFSYKIGLTKLIPCVEKRWKKPPLYSSFWLTLWTQKFDPVKKISRWFFLKLIVAKIVITCRNTDFVWEVPLFFISLSQNFRNLIVFIKKLACAKSQMFLMKNNFSPGASRHFFQNLSKTIYFLFVISLSFSILILLKLFTRKSAS